MKIDQENIERNKSPIERKRKKEREISKQQYKNRD